MKKDILNFPEQFKQGLELAAPLKISGQFNKVVVSGMGGSAWPAEILSTWLNLPIQVNRNYQLPASEKDLAIFSSYSGNTEECLAAYQLALDRKITTAVITSGGQLKELCQQNETPLVEIPTGLVPRMATGYIFSALYSILAKANLIKDKSPEIIEMADSLKPANQEKEGQGLAKKLTGKIPIIYSSDKLKALAYIWKIKFNENSKSPAFSHYFPELNHNELEGMLGQKNNFYTLILKDSGDQSKIKQRMDLTLERLNASGLPAEVINLSGSSLLSRIFSSILLADWTSYYLAENYQIDPFEVKAIEEFKKKMRG